ncbi:sec-independent protein translocase protein TATA, chloroplastic-like [Olea europaea var. sylvestris]|uniref:Sec-independent translocase TATA, chloroplastic-like n=1 Tax=Olea europaea subsp. europaea TaxID=158383 RepID=A0A8S0V1H6_OLEEU|nr:sec-independent protein translocase protein TATA, chloroplastic-like [Olea europaea var. sylvestris]CAA3024649.1 sec-independent translocase TATA, chloroplastic-like [Olea europaea subsp. europaea]
MATIPSAAINLALSTRFKPFMGTSLLGSSSSVFFNNNISGCANLSLVLGGSRRMSRNQKKGMSCNCLFGLGVPELVVIAGVAALVFGPKQIPEVGRSIGKTVKSFQQAAKEFETELKKDTDSPLESPEYITRVREEEKQEAEVSSMESS